VKGGENMVKYVFRRTISDMENERRRLDSVLEHLRTDTFYSYEERSLMEEGVCNKISFLLSEIKHQKANS